MALPKVCGIETEYGVISRGFDSSPIVSRTFSGISEMRPQTVMRGASR